MSGMSQSAIQGMIGADIKQATSTTTPELNSNLNILTTQVPAENHLGNAITSLPLATLAKNISQATGLPLNICSLSIEYGLHHAELKSGSISPTREVALHNRLQKIEERFKQLGAPDFILQYSKNLCQGFAADMQLTPGLTKADIQSAFTPQVFDPFVAILKEKKPEIKAAMKADDPIRINQIKSWDCGPTAHAIILAPLVGIPATVLAEQFRKIQGSGGMDWDNPKKFVKYVNKRYGKDIKLIDQGDISAEKIAQYLNDGCQVTASFKGLITKGGHITAFGAVNPKGDTFTIENLDPNGKNITRGLTQLSEAQIDRYTKQAWVFAA